MEFEKKINNRIIVGGGSERTAGVGSLDKAVKVNKKVRKRAIVADIAKAALAVGIFALSLKFKKKKK